MWLLISVIIKCSNGKPPISYRITTLKMFFFLIYKESKKNNWNDFCKEFIKKINTWNIRCLGEESFVPAKQQTSVLYCRLSDFKCFLFSEYNSDWFIWLHQIMCFKYFKRWIRTRNSWFTKFRSNWKRNKKSQDILGCKFFWVIIFCLYSLLKPRPFILFCRVIW